MKTLKGKLITDDGIIFDVEINVKDSEVCAEIDMFHQKVIDKKFIGQDACLAIGDSDISIYLTEKCSK